METIFALSSGAAPAGIAVIRISGPAAADALLALTGKLPEPRRACLAKLRDDQGEILDHALTLWFPGPASVTGEDLAELHLHGGKGVVAAVEWALAGFPSFRRALPGEFTRRAFTNGRIDLAEAEGLADLLAAETEIQRRAAVASAGGVLSRRVEDWRVQLLALSARVEALLDFDDEDDVAREDTELISALTELVETTSEALSAPSAELLREGFRVALAGPPNAGKSTLFNALVESEAAITAPIPGTTRDVLTRPVALAGIPFLFVDMAGLREDGADEVEKIGIARAQAEIERSDIVLWLGPEGQGPVRCWEIDAQCDRADHQPKRRPHHRLSAYTGDGVGELKAALVQLAGGLMPKPGEAAMSVRQRQMILDANRSLSEALGQSDLLCVAEGLRRARLAFDRLVGRSSTEDVLDTLFGRFCIGK